MKGRSLPDMVYGGVAPNQHLRVKTNPTPIGSLLQQPRRRLSVITTDIDGPRALGGQPFDIGADEFDGQSVCPRTSKQQPW
ncbi:MAG: hypothetical protein IPP80_00410 [Ignavibacteria bacterium]|nr:hypothetical protein [Ignavibacteria bacterium]